jgi:hypothetical protein
MSDLQQWFPIRYARTAVYTVEVASGVTAIPSFAAATVTASCSVTYVSPSVFAAGGYAQWSSIIPTGTLSQWQIQGIKRLNQVLLLPNNWDSYGSSPPTPDAANIAMDVLTGIDIEYFVAPQIIPVSGGGLQLEWEIGSRRLELEILHDGSVEYLTLEGMEPREEGRIRVLKDVRSLYGWLLAQDLVQIAA